MHPLSHVTLFVFLNLEFRTNCCSGDVRRFGDLPLTDLDLSHCGSLDQVATLQLIIEKFQGLTKLALRGWKITDLTEGGLFFHFTLFFIPDVQRLWTYGQPADAQHGEVRTDPESSRK